MRLVGIAVFFGVFSFVAIADDNLRGIAEVDVSVGRDGRISAVEVVEAPGYLEAHVQAWAESQIFDPATVGDEPVPSTSSVSIKYELDEVDSGYEFRVLDYWSGFRAVKRVQPQYPRSALLSRKEGWVQMKFTMTSEGLVENARVVESSDVVFERPALKALKRWKFKVPTVNGEGVPAEAEQKLEFQLGRDAT